MSRTAQHFAVEDSARDAAAGVDERVRLHGVPWADYERLLEIRGESAVPRMTYLQGELELMTPSHPHERIKKMLARLLEAWAEEQGIELEGVGSWTVKSREAERGAEADECYCLGPIADEPRRPDLAIEVVWTSGGVDKLEVWRGLGVPEVWIWQDDALRFFRLEGGAYAPRARSDLLPGIDPDLLLRCMAEPTQTAAVRALRAAVRR